MAKNILVGRMISSSGPEEVGGSLSLFLSPPPISLSAYDGGPLLK